MKEFWDDRYSSKQYIYGRQPNQFFREKLDTLEPGRILLPAEGEGRNAVWAARKGWNVVAYDYSMQGREKALQLASEFEVEIDYRLTSHFEARFPDRSFDAVGLFFTHLPAAHQPQFFEAITGYLKIGGAVIMECFSKKQLKYQEKYNSGGPGDISMLYSVDAVVDYFSNFEREVLEEREVNLSEGAYHRGPASVIRLFGFKTLRDR